MNPKTSQLESTPTGYSECYLAFIDVLGFSSIISKTALEPKLITAVHEALDGITRRAKLARSPEIGIQITSFSDNVVISIPVSPAGLFHIMGLINNFSQELLSLGMLFRGAIVRGFILHTAEVIFGPALVEAYQLETNISLHPRVMLSDNVMADAKAYVVQSKDRNMLLQRLVREDAYDVPYLNLFADWNDDNDAWKPEAIAKLNVLRAIIERGLSENKRRPSIAEKYRWMARRLDAFILEKRLGSHVPTIG
ncbi:MULTISPECIES: hypothetical protein [Agrobacterium]|uniref:Guanylate cyclase domain-containing protein n=1 Tax=Agrobacterium genomosp. 13 str. CFBP 6927 TaxID=1183428 RepID=A0ABP2BMV2_9HYPH|nr:MULTISPECIES: hypothetical protein [Agrobacterium]TZG34296.1 hypothetical protein AGR1_16450 [Agrobacterium sp. B1(2019)]CUX58468.1 conserved hypothetical protein [Agrobacterium genomosp. 13 str. CFBP 6927]